MRRCALVVALLLLAPVAPLAASDSTSALRRGNRLFREGDLAAALEAYAQGLAPEPAESGLAPLLAYNLGATAHRLGRLPEALLWYRRAERGLADDPWLLDNLTLAREALGAIRHPPPGFAGWLADQEGRAAAAGIAVAWGALALALLGHGRVAPRAILVTAAAAGVLYGASALPGVVGPFPAVLLEECSAPAGELPAGSEVWVVPAPGARWRLAGGAEPASCHAGAVALIDGSREARHEAGSGSPGVPDGHPVP